MKKIIIISLLLFVAGCSTVQYKNDYQQTAAELEQELKNDNLTPVQKVIIRHAITGLQQAQKTDKENRELRNNLISESKKSGAGTFAYGLLLVGIMGIIAFIIAKIKSIL